MNSLIQQLKNAGEDFEFYPTTKEMITTIWNHRRRSGRLHSRLNGFGDVLDIGCGNCNFKRWVEELNKTHSQQSKNDEEGVAIGKYFVMEKSRILLDRLDSSTICLGTDFYENTLIDKPVDTIFCNPPYSDYEEWAARIITESVCKSIYLIIPQRWKNSERIQLVLKSVARPYSKSSDYEKQEDAAVVLGSTDFLDAERSARAKVDIVFIDKSHTHENAGFDAFFDNVFNMNDSSEKFDSEWREAEAKSERLKTELIAGKNKIEILCNGYDDARNTLFQHFKSICALDADTLKTIGIEKKNVKEALKNKFSGLKNLYWNAAFDCLEEITSRLTSKSRRSMQERFTALHRVDFTASNVYALVIWVIKNSNDYYRGQMIDFFMALSEPENVKNYKSNQRVFARNDWGYNKRDHDHYTLDYRIVCTKHALPGEAGYSYQDRDIVTIFKAKISDICTVANNLGFPVGTIDLPKQYGEKGDAMLADNTILFTFRCYQNGNVHVKFDKEFMKALNVEVARELGWIHSREDIAREFTEEMATGAEKYFKSNFALTASRVPMLAAAVEEKPIPAEFTDLPLFQ